MTYRTILPVAILATFLFNACSHAEKKAEDPKIRTVNVLVIEASSNSELIFRLSRWHLERKEKTYEQYRCNGPDCTI